MQLRTPRLRLEPLKAQHATALFPGLRDESLYEYISERPPSSVDSLRERYARLERRRSPDNAEEWLNWALWSSLERCYVGYVQATVNPAKYNVTIAYVLFRQYWGKGYATEAVGEMIAFLKRKYSSIEIVAFTEKKNLRSIALLGRLGFIEDLEVPPGASWTASESKFTLVKS